VRPRLTPAPPDRLGTYIALSTDSLRNASSWPEFIRSQRGDSEIPSTVSSLPHPAASLLSRISKTGVPVLLSEPPWSAQQKHAVIARGSHQSAKLHASFLRNEMADMIEQKFWTVVPFSWVQTLPNLKLSPMGVVPQRDRRSRPIVDYSFYHVNKHTLPLAPSESMQFGRAFERILHRIHHANRSFGPVHLIKVDLADGFYRIPLADSHLPQLAVAFPHLPHEEPLVAFPLVLPMGWVASPPYFCALTETAADLANAQLLRPAYPQPHPLSYVAHHPNNETPVSLSNTQVYSYPDCPPPLSEIPVPASTSSGRPLLPSPVAQAPPSLLPPVSTVMPTTCRPALSPPALQDRSHTWSTTECSSVPFPINSAPFQASTPSRPLSYVDVYMDDFLALAQGHGGQRNHVRATLFHAIDRILRPLHPTDSSFRKQPISMKKLHKGDAKWSTRKVLLGWIVDTIDETITLPDHRAERLHHILSTLLQKRRISLKMWQQQLGELRSMVLAIPGGRGLFSTLYTGLTNPLESDSRLRITRHMHDALLDLSHLATDLHRRPTRIGEITDSLPAAYGAADASRNGMGGVWLSSDPSFPPTLWRHPFPPFVHQKLVTWENPTGSVSNSDLELLAQIASQDILICLRDCRERTIAALTDNIAARAWQQKGSRATIGPAAYLLRISSLHQRHHRYRVTTDYIPGPINVMADDASRLWHLSDDALLSHFNSTYPQNTSWQLSHPRPNMLSALTTALLCKRSEPGLFLLEPSLGMPIGFDGFPIVQKWNSTLRFVTNLMPSPSSRSLPIATVRANLPPAIDLSGLVQWKRPSAPLARRWPAWGPKTRVSIPMVT
jgi:hypothetical protein